jgi:hypothetical protein
MDKETRIVLNEKTFTNIIKYGFVKYDSSKSGRNDITFNKLDIKSLCLGEIVEKTMDDGVVKFVLEEMDPDYVIEIVKRSPIFSEIANKL